MTPDEFIAWRKRLGLNRIQAAETLGLSKNMPSRYESGQAAIPRYVALACAAVAFGLPPLGGGW